MKLLPSSGKMSKMTIKWKINSKICIKMVYLNEYYIKNMK